MRDTAGMKFDCIFEEPLEFIDIDYIHLNKTIRYEQRPHGECKIYHARFEDRIACKCGFMQVITGHWDDYNYCQRCGRKALKEGEEQ